MESCRKECCRQNDESEAKKGRLIRQPAERGGCERGYAGVGCLAPWHCRGEKVRRGGQCRSATRRTTEPTIALPQFRPIVCAGR